MNMTIKNRLIIVFLVILIIPSLTIGWFSYQSAKDQLTTEFIHSANQSIEFANSQINDLISKSLSDMDYLATRVNESMIDGENNTELREVLEPYKAVNPQYEVVIYGTSDKFMFFTPHRDIPGYDPTTRSWFIKAMENEGEAIISEPFLSATNGHVAVNPAKTTEDGSGVVGASLVLNELAEQVNSFKVGQEGYVYILDQEGKVISHPTITPGEEYTESHIEEFYAIESGTLDYVNDEGENQKSVFVTNELTGWKIIGAINMAEIERSTQGVLYTTLIVIAGAVIVGILLLIWIVRSITKPLNQLKEGMAEIASGNLTYELDSERKDEIGEIFYHLNQTSNSLKELIGKISANSELIASSASQLTASSEQTSQASEHISYTIQEVAAGSEKQSKSVEESTQVVTEMSRGVQQITENAKNLSTNANSTSEKASIGNQAIQHTIDQMNAIQATVNNLGGEIKSLGDQSKQIGDIIQTITDISGQTNLLALNAAIEAARAGEYGKGFAVVADEVRKLAEQSAASADQITQLISKNREQTDIAVKTMEATTQEVLSGINMVNSAGQSFKEIQQSTDDVTKQTEEVSSAIQQLSDSANMIVNTIDVISEVAQQTASGTQNVSASTQEQLASLEEVTASASALSEMAEELQSLINNFKI